METRNLLPAVVRRLNPAGVGFLEDVQTGRVYGFTFDQIAGYRGQTIRELALHVGSHVGYLPLNEGQISVVVLPIGVRKCPGLLGLLGLPLRLLRRILP